MNYVSERITNISELEAIIKESYLIAQSIQKESPHNENFRKLIENLQKASNFEFCIERRKTREGVKVKDCTYSHNDIENNLGDLTEEKHIVCDVLPLEELRQLLLDGWVIYDTRPMINTEDMKVLTLVKVN